MLDALYNPDAIHVGAAPPGAPRPGPTWDARLRGLVTSLETRVPGSACHARRVADQSRRIGLELGLPLEEVERIDWAARVHDCGKVIVSPEILEKPGRLTPCEFAEVQRHAAFGARLVSSVGDPVLTAIVRHHHERIDGSGYPDRLVGDAIPIGARIVAVADTFDALTGARPYREARSPVEAMAVIAEESGRTFDPRVVAAFIA
jgi:HD-GYP domain-containing protein (c-di-GMP phosphodiesterase class II)